MAYCFVVINKERQPVLRGAKVFWYLARSLLVKAAEQQMKVAWGESPR